MRSVIRSSILIWLITKRKASSCERHPLHAHDINFWSRWWRWRLKSFMRWFDNPGPLRASREFNWMRREEMPCERHERAIENRKCNETPFRESGTNKRYGAEGNGCMWVCVRGWIGRVQSSGCAREYVCWGRSGVRKSKSCFDAITNSLQRRQSWRYFNFLFMNLSRKP